MLKIIKSSDTPSFQTSSKNISRVESEAKYERLWNIDKERFNPLKSALGRNRQKRLEQVIEELEPLKSLSIVDLGTGTGWMAKKCAEKGGEVTAIDIAEGALKNLRGINNITCLKQYVPYTVLPDHKYDLVLALDLIAELAEKEHRLFFSELARLAKKEGKIVVSTSLDLSTEAPLEQFLKLAMTELEIETIIKSYHSLYSRFLFFLKRWKWSRSLLGPLIRKLENNDFLLRILAPISESIYDEQGVTHVIIVGKVRPCVPTKMSDPSPIERKTKKSVWE